MADVGREPRIAFHTELQGLSHVVERVGQYTQVWVLRAFETRVEPAASNCRCGLGRGRQRPNGATRGENTQQDSEPRRDQRCKEQCDSDTVECRFLLFEGAELEVRTDAGNIPADKDVQFAVDVDDLAGRNATIDHPIDDLLRQVCVDVRSDTANPLFLIPNQVAGDTDVGQRFHRGLSGGRFRPQITEYSLRISQGGRHGGVFGLTDQVVLGQPIGGDSQKERQRDGAEGDREQDASA